MVSLSKLAPTKSLLQRRTDCVQTVILTVNRIGTETQTVTLIFTKESGVYAKLWLMQIQQGIGETAHWTEIKLTLSIILEGHGERPNQTENGHLVALEGDL